MHYSEHREEGSSVKLLTLLIPTVCPRLYGSHICSTHNAISQGTGENQLLPVTLQGLYSVIYRISKSLSARCITPFTEKKHTLQHLSQASHPVNIYDKQSMCYSEESHANHWIHFHRGCLPSPVSRVRPVCILLHTIKRSLATISSTKYADIFLPLCVQKTFLVSAMQTSPNFYIIFILLVFTFSSTLFSCFYYMWK